MRKIFSLLIVGICFFGFIGVVNAEEQFSNLQEDTTFFNSLIVGTDVTQNDTVKAFFEKYDVWYTSAKIEDDSLYQDYLEYTLNGESNDSEATINALIPTVNSTSDLGSWTKTEAQTFAFENLEQGKGYVVGVAVALKSDNSTIYVYRDVYEASSTTTLSRSYELHYNDFQSTTNETTEVTTSENPDTGISDIAIYLVPICLVGGTLLMFRRNYA